MALPDGTVVTIGNLALHPSASAPMGRMVTFHVAVPDQDAFDHSVFVPNATINPTNPATGDVLDSLTDEEIVNAAWGTGGGDVERRANALTSPLVGQTFVPPA